jgi:hypothetical protein
MLASPRVIGPAQIVVARIAVLLQVDPKVDYAFKRVFGMERNRDILIHLLNAILARALGRPIVSIEILNPFSSKDALDDKLSILDIKARDQSGRRQNDFSITGRSCTRTS